MKRLKYILLVVLSCCLLVVPTTITTYADTNDNVVTESANLLKYPYVYGSSKPADFDVYSLPNGVIVLNGVCTTRFNLMFSTGLEQNNLTAGYYYFISGADSSVNLQMILVNRIDSTVLSYIDYGEGTTFYLDSNDWYIRADLNVYPGTYENYLVYPMLNEGQTALPYQPPVGAQKDLYGGMVSMLGDSMNNVLSAFGNSISYVTDNVFFFSTEGGVVLSEYGIITVICAGICLCLGLFKFIFNFFIKGV